MSEFTRKFKLIFIPYMVITVGTIISYTFLNWLILVKLQLLKVDEEIINVFIPFLLPWVPLLIWLRPRLKLLKLNRSGRKNPMAGLIYVSGLSMMLPLIMAQAYMVSATGKLNRLDNIAQIGFLPPTKYYVVKNYYVNKSLLHTWTVFSVSGKGKTDFDMDIYVCVPVFDHLFPDTNKIAMMRNGVNEKALIIVNGKLSTMAFLKKLPADSIQRMNYLNPTIVMPRYGNSGKYGALMVLTRGYKIKTKLPRAKISPAAWLAIKYHQTISNNLLDTEKKIKYRQFVSVCDMDYKHKPLNKFFYLDRLPYNKDLKHYTDAIILRGDVEGGEPVILTPIFQSFNERNGNKLFWIFGSLAIGAGIFLIILCFIRLRTIDAAGYQA